mmetsp:Transcript_24618/g.97686  ORF Transcript_24618/g.97686 Transcript_24618/m.97686 type:complete len:287 (-) Transcript_24618:2050-2910(-)
MSRRIFQRRSGCERVRPLRGGFFQKCRADELLARQHWVPRADARCFGGDPVSCGLHCRRGRCDRVYVVPAVELSAGVGAKRLSPRWRGDLRQRDRRHRRRGLSAGHLVVRRRDVVHAVRAGTLPATAGRELVPARLGRLVCPRGGGLERDRVPGGELLEHGAIRVHALFAADVHRQSRASVVPTRAERDLCGDGWCDERGGMSFRTVFGRRCDIVRAMSRRHVHQRVRRGRVSPMPHADDHDENGRPLLRRLPTRSLLGHGVLRATRPRRVARGGDPMRSVLRRLR